LPSKEDEDEEKDNTREEEKVSLQRQTPDVGR
jgi:hypothetical protein